MRERVPALNALHEALSKKERIEASKRNNQTHWISLGFFWELNRHDKESEGDGINDGNHAEVRSFHEFFLVVA